MMNAMITQTSPDAIRQAAEELVARHGKVAVELAAQRAEALAQEGRWPEHAVALRMLTEVERLVRGESE
jgi:hypothetical protein